MPTEAHRGGTLANVSMSRRLGQRALDELRKQTMMLVDTTEGGASPAPEAAATTTTHDPSCQLDASGRLDETCGRCRTILTIADS